MHPQNNDPAALINAQTDHQVQKIEYNVCDGSARINKSGRFPSPQEASSSKLEMNYKENPGVCCHICARWSSKWDRSISRDKKSSKSH